MRRTHVYIVGAGFSKYAWLPLQKDFTEALLAARADEAHPMQPLIGHLGRFVHDAFDHNESAKAKFWPNLEDVFTNIDLAANTGHRLGPTYSTRGSSEWSILGRSFRIDDFGRLFHSQRRTADLEYDVTRSFRNYTTTEAPLPYRGGRRGKSLQKYSTFSNPKLYCAPHGSFPL
jgi:hypothetical protein